MRKTKAILEQELKQALNKINNVEKALQNMVDNYCEDSYPPIEDFCRETGFELPVRKVSYTFDLFLPVGIWLENNQTIKILADNQEIQIDDYYEA